MFVCWYLRDNIPNFDPETGYSNLKKEATHSSETPMLLCQSSFPKLWQPIAPKC